MFPNEKFLYGETNYRIRNRGSLSVCAITGAWTDFEANASGTNLVSLIEHVYGISFKEALDYAIGFIKQNKAVSNIGREQKNVAVLKQAVSERKTYNKKQALLLDDMAKKRAFWKTLGRCYLAGRGINVKALPFPAYQQLGFLSSHYHPESNKEWPVVTATIRDHKRRRMGVLRIYTSMNGQEKAPIDMPKKALGTTKGMSIHLTPKARKLILTEGLEDGLSILLAVKDKPQYGVWCGIGGSVTSIIIPEGVKEVILAFDNDPAGKNFTEKLAKRLVAEGLKVKVARPAKGKDFNEMLCKYNLLFNTQMMETYNA